jgi:hypothetical protein
MGIDHTTVRVAANKRQETNGSIKTALEGERKLVTADDYNRTGPGLNRAGLDDGRSGDRLSGAIAPLGRPLKVPRGSLFSLATASRRFSTPWSVRELEQAFRIEDATGRPLPTRTSGETKTRPGRQTCSRTTKPGGSRRISPSCPSCCHLRARNDFAARTVIIKAAARPTDGGSRRRGNEPPATDARSDDCYASFSHFFRKLFLAAPFSGLPLLSTALGSHASFLHFWTKLFFAAPVSGFPLALTALLSHVS